MSSTPRMAHIVLQTNQLEAMREWYCDVLDAHLVFEGHGLSFITFDDEHHRVAFIQVPVELQPKSPLSAGMHHTAYTFDSLEGLLDRYTALAAKGIHPKAPTQHGATTSIYYADPDGNFVELQIDNFATPEETTEYLQGPEYSNDPIGVGFDPSLMRDALRNGARPEELITRSWASSTSPELPNPMVTLSS